MFSNEDHLRVTKVKTTDGVNPVYDSNNNVVKKIVELPLSAKKRIDEQNDLLPNQLKMKVEVIKAYNPPPVVTLPDPIAAVPDPQIAEMQNKINELEAQNSELKKKKGGRPKKIKQPENA